MPAGEVQPADSMNMSGTPIREATTGLPVEGLVDLRAGAGTMVSSIRPEAVRIARFGRETLEPGIPRISVKSSSNLAPFSMGQAIEERELAAAQSGADHFLRADDRMHRASCRHAGRKTVRFALSDAGRTWTEWTG